MKNVKKDREIGVDDKGFQLFFKKVMSSKKMKNEVLDWAFKEINS